MQYFAAYCFIGMLATAVRYWLLKCHPTPNESLLQKVAQMNAGTRAGSYADGKVPALPRLVALIAEVVATGAGILAWPVVLYGLIQRHRYLHRDREWVQKEANELAANERRIKQMSVTEIEAREMPVAGDSSAPALPFVFLNPAWLRFKVQIRDGDEIWLYEFHPYAGQALEAWKHGAEGYLLLRQGKEIARQISNAG